MNTDLIKKVNEFKNLFFEISSFLSVYDKLETEVKSLKANNTLLKSKISDLEKNNRNLNNMVSYYESKTEKIVICGYCNGLGGFSYDDGYGNYGGEDCPECQGSGLLPYKEAESNIDTKPHKEFE